MYFSFQQEIYFCISFFISSPALVWAFSPELRSFAKHFQFSVGITINKAQQNQHHHGIYDEEKEIQIFSRI